jgi:hypothetical protein
MGNDSGCRDSKRTPVCDDFVPAKAAACPVHKQWEGPKPFRTTLLVCPLANSRWRVRSEVLGSSHRPWKDGGAD